MTKEEIRAIQPDQVISDFHRSLLSAYAVKVLITLWYDAAFKNRNVLVVDNRQIGSRAKIPFQRLYEVQDELVKVGLMKIDRLNEHTTRYEFVESPETDETDEQIWEQYASTIAQ